jgi:3-oxoacyl-[acyl-carrier-protein] synthase II
MDQSPSLRSLPREALNLYNFKSRFYSPFPEADPRDFGLDSAALNVMQRKDRAALVAAKLALDDAGFCYSETGKLLDAGEPERGGVIFGIGLGELADAFGSYLSHIGKAKGPEGPRYQRMIIPKIMPNSVAAWVSIHFGLQGPGYTLNASCASGTYAVGEAFEKIRRGSQDLMLCGGVECLKEESMSMMRGFDMLGVLTLSPDGRPRPFSKTRSGFLFSEGGACALVLEEEGRARKRGAEIYAEITDFQANSDSHNIVQMEPTGEKVIRLLEALKAGARIDYLNAHGTGTAASDEIEAKALNAVFGGLEDQPVLNSTKAILGHTIGASGAFEAAVTALAIKEQKIHGSRVNDPMEGLRLAGESREMEIGHAVSVSYGFGGHNAGLLFKRYEKE